MGLSSDYSLCRQWQWRVNQDVLAEMKKHRDYDKHNPVHLIYFARNLLEHVPVEGSKAWTTMANTAGEGFEQRRRVSVSFPRRCAAAYLTKVFPGLNLLVYLWHEAIQRIRVPLSNHA